MKGYDIDGVIFGGGLVPEPDAVIITGRPYPVAAMTLAQLNLFRIPNFVFFNPYHHDHEWAAKHKAQVINAIGVTEFYEDVEQQAEIIRSCCPNTKVIIVKPREESK